MASPRSPWLLLLAMVFVSCQRNGSSSKSGSSPDAEPGPDSLALAKESNPTESPQGVVRDRSLYSQGFLAKLDWATEGKPYVLDKGLLIMEGADTVRLPQVPPFGKTLRLERDHEGKLVRLEVTRKNWTSLDYRLEVSVAGKKPQVESGSAEIPATFFLGAESDESETSGEAYFVDEYTDSRPDDCTISLRLGFESEGDGMLSGRVLVNCPSLGLPDLAGFPALVQK